MTRAAYTDARSALRTLRRHATAITDIGYHWQDAERRRATREHFARIVYPPCPGQRRDAELRRMAAEWAARRYRHALRRAERLQAERAAQVIAQTDFSGMTPLAAAMERIRIKWGTCHV